MADKRTHVEELVSSLKRERDEMKLRIHLAEMDAKTEYERLAMKVDQLSDHWAPLRNIATETADNVLAAFALAADEIKLGLKRLKNSVAK
jgi:hypothetical protein